MHAMQLLSVATVQDGVRFFFKIRPASAGKLFYGEQL